MEVSHPITRKYGEGQRHCISDSLSVLICSLELTLASIVTDIEGKEKTYDLGF